VQILTEPQKAEKLKRQTERRVKERRAKLAAENTMTGLTGVGASGQQLIPGGRDPKTGKMPAPPSGLERGGKRRLIRSNCGVVPRQWTSSDFEGGGAFQHPGNTGDQRCWQKIPWPDEADVLNDAQEDLQVLHCCCGMLLCEEGRYACDTESDDDEYYDDYYESETESDTESDTETEVGLETEVQALDDEAGRFKYSNRFACWGRLARKFAGPLKAASARGGFPTRSEDEDEEADPEEPRGKSKDDSMDASASVEEGSVEEASEEQLEEAQGKFKLPTKVKDEAADHAKARKDRRKVKKKVKVQGQVKKKVKGKVKAAKKKVKAKVKVYGEKGSKTQQPTTPPRKRHS
jgi:hypothetical protein